MSSAPSPPLRALPCLVLLLMSGMLGAQTTRVSGKVTDANTGEPLPFTSVAFVDSRISTTTDFDGVYTFDTYYATDSLRVTAVGYRPLALGVQRDKAQTIDFALQPALADLPEVVVTYTENSAFAILRQLVRNKPVNNRAKLAAYEYESYNKVEFDLNNITEDFKKKKLFKDFDFIFDYVDSTTKKPSLPIFMTETLSDVYYRQEPKARREVIKGSRVSGVENESITQFMGDMYQNVNVYENFLDLFGKNFVSPIADNGKQHYDYLLLDSNWVGHNWCYLIRFKPRHKQQLCFTGEMWINDTSFAVRRIDASIDPGTNLNFVQEFQVHQEYDEVAREVWMLTRDELLVDLNPLRDTGDVSKNPLQGFYGRRTASYKDFVINKPRDDKFYEGVNEVVVELEPLSLGADYWDQHRHVQLTKRENDIYHMVDTMKRVPRFRTYIDIVNTVVTGYYPRGSIEIGPYFTTLSFNTVEGARFRLGARTSNQFSKWVEFEGYGAVGTKDGEFKYGLKTRGFISKQPRLLYRAGYKHDIEQLGQSLNAFREDNILSSVFRRNPASKLTMVNEFMVGLDREWFTGLDNTVLFRHRVLRPRGTLSYEQPATDPDVPPTEVESITTSEVVLNTRFAHKEKYVSGEFDRISLGTPYPVIESHFAFGIPGLLQGDYAYQKVVLRLQQRVPLRTLGNANYMITAGQLWGALPYPLLFLHSGNETFYYDDEAFNTMNYFEFISDRAVSLMLEWHLDGYAFNRIPLFRRLKWREVAGFKTVIGSLDREKHEQEMLFLPEMYDLEGGPFMEASAGIENIFKLLRVDGIWRLRYNDHANTRPFALRVKLYINF